MIGKCKVKYGGQSAQHLSNMVGRSVCQGLGQALQGGNRSHHTVGLDTGCCTGFVYRHRRSARRTKDDPIPAERGMEYVYGLYYSDGEDRKLCLCQRTGEAAGGMVVLRYLPHELVGHYFVDAS